MNHVERFYSKVEHIPEHACTEWVSTKFNTGYGAFWMNGQNHGAHRVAWELEHGEIPAGMFVCHKCDNPGCVRLEHLFLGSIQDNNEDKKKKCRQARGESMGAAKLTDEQVREIRAVYARGGIGQVALGKRYGVGHTTISYIVNNHYWKHVL